MNKTGREATQFELWPAASGLGARLVTAYGRAEAKRVREARERHLRRRADAADKPVAGFIDNFAAVERLDSDPGEDPCNRDLRDINGGPVDDTESLASRERVGDLLV